MLSEELKKKNGVYAYIDISGRYPKIVYIGITIKNFNERDKHHRRRKGRFIDSVLQKNPNKYKMISLKTEYKDINHLNELEEYYIKYFDTYWYNNKSCFNLTLGGSAHGISKEEMSERLKDFHKEHPENAINHSKKMKNYFTKTENRVKNSLKYNSTGFLNLTKTKDKKSKNGFYWIYQYRDDKKRKKISRRNLRELEKICRELKEWVIIDLKLYEKTLKINDLYLLLNFIEDIKIVKRNINESV